MRGYDPSGPTDPTRRRDAKEGVDTGPEETVRVPWVDGALT